MDLIGLATSTANCPITLSDYNCIEWLVKYKAADAPITFQEIEMVMINDVNAILALKVKPRDWNCYERICGEESSVEAKDSSKEYNRLEQFI